MTIFRVILLFTFWHQLLVPNKISLNTHLKEGHFRFHFHGIDIVKGARGRRLPNVTDSASLL